TFMKGGVVSERGDVLDFMKVRTPEGRKVEDVLDVISEIVRKFQGKYEISSIGVASPGSVTKDGVVLFSPNFPLWKDVPLKDFMQARFSLPVVVDNDANAYAFGEYEIGVAKGVGNFILLTLGTGVGGAVFCEGRLFKGSIGIGGELGHIIVGSSGPTCGCGNIGCLETYSSLRGIQEFAARENLNEEQSKPMVLLNLATRGDLRAKKIINIFKDYLIKALISYIHIFNPQLVVLGGGLSRDYKVILSDLTEIVNERVMPSFKGTFKVVFSSLSDEAGVVGIALMALKDGH
ncbi:MAG: ROK family protein, partial [Chloroflexi bacterium]|nr:ROK family protein [Chloroflexota bacterium]